MADYYYEARKHDKWLRRHAKENKARKERMKEFQRAHSRDHQQSLIIEGKPCKLYRDAAAGSVEATLMPWNGRHDVLIDRFDARAVLDMVPLSPKDTGDHREKKGLETFLSFERYRGILDAQRAGLGEREHTAAVAGQVQEKLAEMARVQQGEPDGAELLAARQAQNERYKKAETKAAMKEAKNAGVYGHYGPSGSGDGKVPSRGRGAEVALQYGGEVVGKPKGDRAGMSAPPEQPDEDEDEAQLDPEILALIEKEVGGGGRGGTDGDSSDGSDFSEDDGGGEEDDDEEEGNNGGEEGATLATQDHLGEEYGISEKRSGYSYSRLLRYERRHRAQQRAIRAEELESAKKRKKSKKKGDGAGEGVGGAHDDGHGNEPGSGSRRVTGLRSRPGPLSVRDSPTYEDFVDPLEARRKKRKEERLREGGGGGVGRESTGNRAGRGRRQYISSFEATDKGGNDSEDSLLDSDSDDDGTGGSSSHLTLLEGFFPTLANSLRKHLQEKKRRESELEAQREKEREIEREREKERQLEHARRRAAARRRRSRSQSRSRSSSRGRGRGREDSRDRGSRSRQGRSRGSGSKRSRRDDASPRSSSSSARRGRRGSESGRSTKAAVPKAPVKKLTPMEMMKLRMRKALESQLEKDKSALAKKSSKETKMAQLDRRQQKLDDKQHERLQARARRAAGSTSSSRSKSRSPVRWRPRGSRSRSTSRSSGRADSTNRGRGRSRSRERNRDDGVSGGAREAAASRWPRKRGRSGSSRSRSGSGSRSHSVPSASHRGSSDHNRGRKRRDDGEHGDYNCGGNGGDRGRRERKSSRGDFSRRSDSDRYPRGR